jgi:hypothetical protein
MNATAENEHKRSFSVVIYHLVELAEVEEESGNPQKHVVHTHFLGDDLLRIQFISTKPFRENSRC